MKDMTDRERDRLLVRLNTETKSQCLLFGGLVASAGMSMQDSNVTAGNLITYFKSAKMEELAGNFQPSDSISTVIAKAEEGGYWDFFNYEVLESIIRHFCDRDKKMLELLDNYISKFQEYCRRRVSEVFVEACADDGASSSSTARVFKVKTDDRFTVKSSLGSIKEEVQYKIEKILGLSPIVLAYVKKGCLELYFRYFKEVDVSEAQMARLEEIGVLSLTRVTGLPSSRSVPGGKSDYFRLHALTA